MPLKIRRGLEEDRLSITPAVAEPIYTTDKKELFFGDGIKPGGHRMFVITEDTKSTASVDPNQVLHEVPIDEYTSVKYLIQVTAGTDGLDRQVGEIRIFHNETDAFVTEYGVMFSSENKLALFSADINDGNLRLLVTPQQGSTTTFQIHSQALKK